MRTRTKVVLGAVVALLIVSAGAGGWLIRNLSGNTDPVAADPVKVGVPTIVSPGELETFAGDHYPVYWAGQQPNTELELTLTSKNAIFVRYLPENAKAGDTHQYLTIATYDAIDGYDALSAAQKNVANVVDAQDGAVIAVFRNRPLSTYFSFQNAGFQVEVFSPKVGESEQLTDDGAVKLVGGS